MAAAVASARGRDGAPLFDVIGVDLPTPRGQERIAAIQAGKFPFSSTDPKVEHAVAEARRVGNLEATADPAVFARARIALVDVCCDVSERDGEPALDLEGLRAAVRTLGRHLPVGALVIVETTVPPGTCQLVLAPELDACAEARGLPAGSFLLAHSYERVMPGDEYFDSVTNFWRVYSGHTPEAADACQAFLSQVIDVERYPLTRVHSTTASETAKVLENSYRATTIALMEEWRRFAESVGIDLFEVVNAIRMRPTHSNMRQPCLGVGGYCLTKDPLFGMLSARELFGKPELAFPFSTLAVETNGSMPKLRLAQLQALLGGDLEGKRVLLAGVSYRPGVGDTRQAPSASFALAARAAGASVICHDPLVGYWPELDLPVERALPPARGLDALVLAVSHREYRDLNFADWLGTHTLTVLDSDNVLRKEQRAELRARGCRVESIGRGAGL